METYEADIAAINELYEQYILAGNTGDLDLFMTLWMDNAIRMVQDTPAIIGQEPIRAHFKVPFEQGKIDPEDLNILQVYDDVDAMLEAIARAGKEAVAGQEERGGL